MNFILVVPRRDHRAPCWLKGRGNFGLHLEIKKMPDLLVHMQGPLIALSALSSSENACQLLNDMQWGTMVAGRRLLTEDEFELALLLIDQYHLTTRYYV